LLLHEWRACPRSELRVNLRRLAGLGTAQGRNLGIVESDLLVQRVNGYFCAVILGQAFRFGKRLLCHNNVGMRFGIDRTGSSEPLFCCRHDRIALVAGLRETALLYEQLIVTLEGRDLDIVASAASSHDHSAPGQDAAIAGVDFADLQLQG